MSGVSITFTPEIIANAKARGVELTRDEIESINTSLNAFITVEGGKIKFTSSSYLDLSEAVEAMSARHGKPIEKPVTSAEPAGLGLPANATRTQQAIARNAELRSQTKVGIYKRNQALELVKTFGNPWMTNNKTHQAFVTNTASDLVAGLKSEAGIR